MEEIFLYYPEGHEAHFYTGHPERPERVAAVREAIFDGGWWDKSSVLDPLILEKELLYAVHDSIYVEKLESACNHGEFLDADTYTTTASWRLALNAAGGAAAVAASVWDNGRNTDIKGGKKGFALTRPPGHHATVSRGMGFCLLNNIAIAAEYLIKTRAAKRLAIVDLDLHHGNGTQDIFWSRDDVFYLSTHQYPLYPGTGMISEIGSGLGEGLTANFPLPPATGDEGYRAIMDEFILPSMDRYKPEMILVSYGFDPHWRDPLGQLLLSAKGYGDIIGSLSRWADLNCKGRIALFLEGGYDLDAGYACTQAAVSSLLMLPWDDYLGPSPRQEGNSWRAVVKQARIIWK